MKGKGYMLWSLIILLTIGGLFAFKDQAWGQQINNPPSTYPHTVDGFFTDWVPGALCPPGALCTYEWFDISPQVGQYSKVYFDYTGTRFYIMNDWIVNTGGMNPTDYNLFTITADKDSWDLRVYGDGTVTLLKNGVPDPTAQGAYGFGSSPNLNTNHTMWEIAIDVGSSRIIEDPKDPRSPGQPPVPDPEFPEGFYVDLHPGGGSTSQPVPEPSTFILLGSGLVGIIVFGRKRLFRKW